MINKQLSKALTLGCFLLSNLIITAPASAQRMGISDTQIPYFSMLKGSHSRPLLVTNPKLCKQAAEACSFFIESSYGHLHLNHLILPPKAYTQHDLHQADCFAVYNVSAQSVQAAIELMQHPQQAAQFAIQGDLAARATNLQNCAKYGCKRLWVDLGGVA